MGEPLRVVSNEPTSIEPSLGSVTNAAVSGSRRDLLVALRAQIAGEIDKGVPARDLASLSLRLLAIAEELEKLTDGEDEVGDAADAPDEPFSAS